VITSLGSAAGNGSQSWGAFGKPDMTGLRGSRVGEASGSTYISKIDDGLDGASQPARLLQREADEELLLQSKSGYLEELS
jgi:hypothetical protein